LLIYAMMVMASPIPTLFAGRIFGTILAPYYFATPENGWRELIQPYLPSWLSPQDPRLAAFFYEGLEQGRPIPWAAWMPTLPAWAPMIIALFLVMITFMVLLRRQWIEHERLIFPLVQVPLAMAETGEEGKRIGPFYTNPVMWAGFALPALWGALHGLYTYFPNVEPWLGTPTGPHLWGWVHTAIGAAFMTGLMVARWRWEWWPLHPLGYPLGATVIMDHLWFNMFLAWFIKTLVLKYGGVGLYQKTRPFFLGMIAGHIVPGGIFLFVDHCTGMTNNPIFWG
jgi:hypothetical protein